MKRWIMLMLAGAMLLALAAPALAMPWPWFRDAGGDAWKDDPRFPMKPTSANYKEYDFAATWPKWADQDIRDAISWDLMKGYEDGKDWIGRTRYRFRAEKEITRAEFVTILNRALGHAEDAQAARAAFSGEVLADWYAGHLGSLVKRGIVDSGGRFDGGRPATRREIAIWLGRVVRTENLPLDVPEPSFPDFRPGDAGYEDAVYALRAGLMRGYEDGTFRPEATFTRAQSAAVIVRLAKSLPPGDMTMTAEEFKRWFNEFTRATAFTHDPAVYLPWVTPEVAVQAFVEEKGARKEYEKAGIDDDSVGQARWDFWRRPNVELPGLPQARAVVTGRTVMLYEIGLAGGDKVGDRCWDVGPIQFWRVWVRRFPEGLRITDTEAMWSEEVGGWWRLPAWYMGWGYWEVGDDGIPRRPVPAGSTCPRN